MQQMSTTRTCVSLPQAVYDDGLSRQRALGYKTFSEYVQALVRADAIAGGSHVREPVAPYGLPASAPPLPRESQVNYRRKTPRHPSRS